MPRLEKNEPGTFYPMQDTSTFNSQIHMHTHPRIHTFHLTSSVPVPVPGQTVPFFSFDIWSPLMSEMRARPVVTGLCGRTQQQTPPFS